MVIENEEHVSDVLMTRIFSDTCYAFYPYTGRQFMESDSSQYDYMITTAYPLSDNPHTSYQYYNLSKNTLRMKNYVCYWDSDSCHLSDDWLYVRDDSSPVWEPKCEW